MTDSPTAPAGALVVGYGNDLRRDDGAGRRAAQAVAARDLPGVRVRSVHQLAPELAAEMSGCRVVVFVDASPAETTLQVYRLAADAPGRPLSHHVGAESLLALVPAVGRPPEAAWMVAIPAADLGLGTGLSAAASEAVADAVECIVELCAEV